MMLTMRCIGPLAPPLSTPPQVPDVVRHSGVSEQTQIEDFQWVVKQMGRSRRHSRLFFKFQSVMGYSMPVVLKAFPDVPWVFVYRAPVETMVSHMGGGPGLGIEGAVARTKVGNPPCLRAQHSPTLAHLKALQDADVAQMHATSEQFCAAHLATLCQNALSAAKQSTRGMFVNYAELPAAVWETVLPTHFGVPVTDENLVAMQKVSGLYSKGREDRHKDFLGDTDKKKTIATAEIKAAADKILQASYQELENHKFHHQ